MDGEEREVNRETDARTQIHRHTHTQNIPSFTLLTPTGRHTHTGSVESALFIN